jgi:hypothetical protein
MEIIWEYLWWNRSLSYFLEWEYGLMVISMRWTFWYWMRIKGYNDDKITKVIRHMSHSYFDRLSQGIKPMSSPWRTGYDHRSWPISTRHLTLCQSPSFVLDGMILAEVILALQEVREYLQPHWPCHGLCGPDALAHVFCKFASSCIEVCFWWSWQKWDSTYCPPGLFLAYVGLTFLHICSVSLAAFCSVVGFWCQSPSFVLDGMILAEVILALQEVREYLQPTWPCRGLCWPDALAHVFCNFASSCIEVCFWW